MPAARHPFHLHTLDEVDVACRIWGARGVRALLDTPAPHSAPPHRVPTPAPDAARQRSARERAGLGWLRLRRAAHAAVR